MRHRFSTRIGVMLKMMRWRTKRTLGYTNKMTWNGHPMLYGLHELELAQPMLHPIPAQPMIMFAHENTVFLDISSMLAILEVISLLPRRSTARLEAVDDKEAHSRIVLSSPTLQYHHSTCHCGYIWAFSLKQLWHTLVTTSMVPSLLITSHAMLAQRSVCAVVSDRYASTTRSV